MEKQVTRSIALGMAVVVILWVGGCGSPSIPGSSSTEGAVAPAGAGKISGRPGVVGLAFTEALINSIQGDLDSFGGWRPNDLLFGKVFENRTNEELGDLAVVRESVEAMKEDIARIGALDTFNPELAKAEADLDADPFKLWSPSAESKLQEGVSALRGYRESLIQGEAKFYPNPENFARLLNIYITLMGDVHERLLAPAGFFKSDNVFYYGHGAALALAQVFAAMQKDFTEEIQAKGLTKLMEEAQTSLDLAAQMRPWIVFDGGDDDFRANHRLNMAAHLNEARTKTFLMLEALKQPQP